MTLYAIVKYNVTVSYGHSMKEKLDVRLHNINVDETKYYTKNTSQFPIYTYFSPMAEIS